MHNIEGIVYCDLDGTLLKGDLEFAYLKYLIKKRKITIYQIIVSFLSVPINYIRKRRFKKSLMKSWTLKKSGYLLEKHILEFLEEQSKNLVLRQEILILLMEFQQKYELVLLTGSQEELVKVFLKYKGIDKLFDKVIGSKVSKSGIIVKEHPYGKDKCKYINNSVKTIGIANEYADSFYLKKCDEVYIVQDDKKLVKLAEQLGWRKI